MRLPPKRPFWQREPRAHCWISILVLILLLLHPIQFVREPAQALEFLRTRSEECLGFLKHTAHALEAVPSLPNWKMLRVNFFASKEMSLVLPQVAPGAADGWTFLP